MATVTISALAFEDPALVTTFVAQLGEANGAAHVPMYKKASDGKYYLADANASAETAGESGLAISLQEGQVDEYITFIAGGKVIAEGSFTDGSIYIVGATAGTIVDDSDAASGWFKSLLFIAGPAATLNVELLIAPLASGYDV